MATAHLNGIDVHHEVHGRSDDDAPWVLNIGGSGGDLRETLPARSPLNEHFRVLQYDQRGLGRTSKPEVEYTMEEYADDAAALIEHVILPTGSPRCHVVGTSFGGMVALNLAARRPDLVDRLVLLVTSPGGDHASYRLSDLADMAPDDAFRTRMGLLDTRWDPEADEPIPDLGVVYDFMVARAQQAVPPEVAAGAARQLRARNGHDVADRLASIDRPTFIGCGRHDAIAPVANSQVIADRMPNAEMRIFEGGHLMMFQDPTLWPTVIDFLSRT